MIDAEALARMKPTAILINTCRGEVVDEAALFDALRQGRILAAGLDTLAQEPTDPVQSAAYPAQRDADAAQRRPHRGQLPQAFPQRLRQYPARGRRRAARCGSLPKCTICFPRVRALSIHDDWHLKVPAHIPPHPGPPPQGGKGSGEPSLRRGFTPSPLAGEEPAPDLIWGWGEGGRRRETLPKCKLSQSEIAPIRCFPFTRGRRCGPCGFLLRARLSFFLTSELEEVWP